MRQEVKYIINKLMNDIIIRFG